MRILAAGGAGFIGSHLTDRLIENGHTVICADKLVMGRRNIAHLEKNRQFQFYQADLADARETEALFKKHKFDAVYHLAANSDIQKGAAEPEIDFQDTLMTTRNLLEAMRKHGVRNLFFASTSAVYGEKPDTRLTETSGELMPVSYYGGAKLASEALISSYVSMCDMHAVIFRFPNVIGPRLTHGVIYDFIRKLRKNPKQLEILGDGTQCKPYLYVLDLVRAIVQLTEQWPDTEQVYNISPVGEGTPVTRIAQITAEEMGLSDVRFLYTGGSRGWKGDVPRFEYDISKVISTGWKPDYTSEEAVKQSVLDAINAGWQGEESKQRCRGGFYELQTAAAGISAKGNQSNSVIESG